VGLTFQGRRFRGRLSPAALGGVGGGFIRSRPGKAGQVTLTATHPTLGEASVGLTVAPVRSETFI
jgi:hypothetical protein